VLSQSIDDRRRQPVHCIVMYLGVLILLLAFMPHIPATVPLPRTQPDLLVWADAHPTSHVQVIVQQQDTANLQGMLALWGGVITKDLPIIHAVAAELPAGAIRALAQAAGVRWVSLDAAMVSTGTTCTACISTTNLKNTYNRTIGADKVWNVAPYLQGQGIGVAIVDSGVYASSDFTTRSGTSRIIAAATFNSTTTSTVDSWGHGTHVAGIIGGNGAQSNGAYIGVAPGANLINVKVGNDVGGINESDVVAGLQWIYNNRNTYNIRVVNLSLNTSVAQSYNTSPLDAAVEILWFNKIVVVVANGNLGKNAFYPPANDPFIMSIGAYDDKGTISTGDDQAAIFSAYGKTSDGVRKPDLSAPGVNIISTMPSSAAIATAHLSNVIDTMYFKMSGTSMAAPMVAGAVALLLQDEPNLTPDQVKYRLMATARKSSLSGATMGAGSLDVYAAVNGTTTASANIGIAPSQFLTTGSQPLTTGTWDAANWGAANWSAANWGAANWNSDYWGN
jgi:serine protease AprX